MSVDPGNSLKEPFKDFRAREMKRLVQSMDLTGLEQLQDGVRARALMTGNQVQDRDLMNLVNQRLASLSKVELHDSN